MVELLFLLLSAAYAIFIVSIACLWVAGKAMQIYEDWKEDK